MVHLIKLAVGIRDMPHLIEAQSARAANGHPLRHRTRHRPRRSAELSDGGSIYWVIAGTLLARQRVVGVIEDCWEDGTSCAGLLLDPSLVQVEGRPVKAFQGWRYLRIDDAPPDLREDDNPLAMPPALRNELRALCLI